MLTTDTRRDAADRDFFYDARLQFGIRKPASWRFMPASRSAPPPNRASASWSDGGRARWRPVVAMVQDIASTRHPRPTIQVSCRPAGHATAAELRRLLEAQLDVLSRELPGFERLACSLDNIIGGRRAAHLQFRYTLNLPIQGGTVPTQVLAHNYLVLTQGLAFTVAMSSSTDVVYYDEGDFAAALASVWIGSPKARQPGSPLDRSRAAGLPHARRSHPATS